MKANLGWIALIVWGLAILVVVIAMVASAWGDPTYRVRCASCGQPLEVEDRKVVALFFPPKDAA